MRAGTGRFLEVISRTLGTNVERSTALPKMSYRTPSRVCAQYCRIRSDQPALCGRSAGSDSRGVINAMARRSANFIARLSCERRFCLLVALVTVKGLPTCWKPSGNAGTNSP